MEIRVSDTSYSDEIFKNSVYHVIEKWAIKLCMGSNEIGNKQGSHCIIEINTLEELDEIFKKLKHIQRNYHCALINNNHNKQYRLIVYNDND